MKYTKIKEKVKTKNTADVPKAAEIASIKTPCW